MLLPVWDTSSPDDSAVTLLKINVRHDITHTQAPFAQLDQHAIQPAAIHLIALLLKPGDTVFLPYQSGIAQTIHAVVLACGVRSNVTEYAPHIGIAGTPPGQTKCMLRLQRIRHIVALQLLFLVQQQYCGIGSAFDIYQRSEKIWGRA